MEKDQLARHSPHRRPSLQLVHLPPQPQPQHLGADAPARLPFHQCLSPSFLGHFHPHPLARVLAHLVVEVDPSALVAEANLSSQISLRRRLPLPYPDWVCSPLAGA